MRSPDPAAYLQGGGSRADGVLAFDAARGLAAVAVLISHARDFLLRDAGEAASLGFAGRFVYAVTGLGHQAVMVFFVISGFLVTRSMLRDAASGRWSWGGYTLDRLTRLWTVLLPCLVIGGMIDVFGRAMTAARLGAWSYGTMRAAVPFGPISLDPTAFAGNLLFRQTLEVPVFGTNTALWSLAYEAHYYLAAGLVFAAWLGRRNPACLAICGVGFAGTLGLMNRPMLLLMPIWLFGSLAAVLTAGRAPRRANGLPSLAALTIALVAARTSGAAWQWGTDLMVGGSAAWTLCALRGWRPERMGGTRWLAQALAARSYTLYASHVPLLALVSALALGPRRLSLGPAAIGLAGAAVAAALLWAMLLWWLFERHTPAVRTLLRAFCNGMVAHGDAAGRRPEQAL